MKIEIRGGPPSRYNPDADNYVVLVLKSGQERLLGGPMTEDNAVEMVDAIRAGRSPEDAAEDYEKKVQPAAPAQRQKATYNHLAWVAIFYIAIAAALTTVVVLSQCEG